MKLHHVAFFLAFLAFARLQGDAEDDRRMRVKSELEFVDWDLEDYCEDLSKVKRDVLLEKVPYKNKIRLELRYGGYLRNQTRKLLKYYKDDAWRGEFERNYTVLTKPGDVLLPNEDWKTLVSFHNSNEELLQNLKINSSGSEDPEIGKREYRHLLSTSRNLSTLRTVWSEWQDEVARYQSNFSTTLQLASKAASLNEKYDAKSYWELLSDYEDGYSTATNIWTEIQPLYEKLHSFVLRRINDYYGENFTDIPVYLLGSNFGEDWSSIVDILLPHPQLLHDVNVELQEKSIRDVYKLAGRTMENLGLGRFGKSFWSHSVFNSSDCQPQVLNFCASRYTEIISCQEVDWLAYLNSHETALEIGVKTVDYTSVPREKLRYSIIDEAVASLGSILAVTSLPGYGFTEEDAFTTGDNATVNQMSALLLIALRVLPKLPFYLAADYWRLEELEAASADMNSNWWELRKKYQGVCGVSDAEADYLGDPFITSNKPYLSKFMGTVLQFQILSYHQLSLFQEDGDIAERLGQQSDFVTLMQEKLLKHPLEALSYNYGFDGVNHYPLLEFFQPLEQYLDSAPLEQAAIIHKPRKPKRVLPPPGTTEPEPAETTTAQQTTTGRQLPLLNDQEVPPNDVKASQTVVKESQNIQVPSGKAEEEVPVSSAGSTDQSGGLYIAITVGACALIIVVVIVFKKVVRIRRSGTNNRRFEA